MPQLYLVVEVVVFFLALVDSSAPEGDDVADELNDWSPVVAVVLLDSD